MKAVAFPVSLLFSAPSTSAMARCRTVRRDSNWAAGRFMTAGEVTSLHQYKPGDPRPLGCFVSRYEMGHVLGPRKLAKTLPNTHGLPPPWPERKDLARARKQRRACFSWPKLSKRCSTVSKSVKVAMSDHGRSWSSDGGV